MSGNNRDLMTFILPGRDKLYRSQNAIERRTESRVF
jgi:hypothetical protein